MMRLVLLLAAILMVKAFSPIRSSHYRIAVSKQLIQQPIISTRIFAEEEEAAAAAAATENPVVSSDGTIYDDEVAPIKPQLSDAMRQRLLAEASTGLDSNSKQTNVLLYIIIGVAVLVVVGGAGIFY